MLEFVNITVPASAPNAPSLHAGYAFFPPRDCRCTLILADADAKSSAATRHILIVKILSRDLDQKKAIPQTRIPCSRYGRRDGTPNGAHAGDAIGGVEGEQ